MYQYYQNNQNENNQNNSSQPEKWYDSLWGIALITLSLNLLSNYLYDKARKKQDEIDTYRERLRERKHLEDYHDKTPDEARKEETETHLEILEE